MKPILVTGATGTVGSEVAWAPQAAGQRVHLSSTDPDRAKPVLQVKGLGGDDFGSSSATRVATPLLLRV